MGLWSRHQERQAQWAPEHNAPFLPATAAHRQNGAQLIDEFLRQGPLHFLFARRRSRHLKASTILRRTPLF